jgi:uncharacterized protein (TIGR02145 family)
MLDIKSNSKGFLIPRMTEEQIESIVAPANGLLVFNLTDGKFYVYRSVNAGWNEIAFGLNVITPDTWVCGMSFTDSRDSKTYSSVQIGSQCWMAENLNAGIRIDGELAQSDNSIIEKYCFSNQEDSCTKYGGFYMWDEMMQYVTLEASQGICPDGWRLPASEDWEILSVQLGGDSEAGIKLKSTVGWDAEGNGNNSSGFNALPSGYRNTDGSFVNNTRYATHWSSTEGSSNTAWNRHLSYEDNIFHETSSWKSYGLSVRCIRDE